MVEVEVLFLAFLQSPFFVTAAEVFCWPVLTHFVDPSQGREGRLFDKP